jgi:hypothetical protein
MKKKNIVLFAVTCAIMYSCQNKGEQPIEEEYVEIEDSIRYSEAVDSVIDIETVGAAAEMAVTEHDAAAE